MLSVPLQNLLQYELRKQYIEAGLTGPLACTWDVRTVLFEAGLTAPLACS